MYFFNKMVFKKFINKFMQIFSIYNTISYNNYFQEMVDYIDENGLHKFLSILTMPEIEKIIIAYKDYLNIFDFSKKIELSKLLSELICVLYNERLFMNNQYSSILNQILYPMVLAHLVDDYESKYIEFIEKINNIDQNFTIKDNQKEDQDTLNLVKEEKLIHKTKIIKNFILSFLLSLLEKYNKVVLDLYFNEDRLNSLNTNMLDASTKLSMLYANFKQNKIKYDSVSS